MQLKKRYEDSNSESSLIIFRWTVIQSVLVFFNNYQGPPEHPLQVPHYCEHMVGYN